MLFRLVLCDKHFMHCISIKFCSFQQLLSTIGNIISSHTKYKRSYDSHFKAFVCAGLK